MVNTHSKFPSDAKYNTSYEANGSDLRDATPEKREKYRLAALHKRKKPEAKSSCGKSGSTTAAAPEGQGRVEDTRNSDSRRRDGGTSHDRDDKETHRRESRDKSGRTSSRDSVKGRGATHRDHSRTGGSRREEKSGYEKRTTPSGKKAKDDSEGFDDDERDRREMAEIVQRIEARKAAKAEEASRLSRKGNKTVESVVNATRGKDKRLSADAVKSADKMVTDSKKTTKKASTARSASTLSYTTQQEAARAWAAEESTDAPMVTQTAAERNLASSKAVKTTEEAKSTETNEMVESIKIQDFMAAQYPPINEGISTTVKLGRSLVSGALGRRTDDPRMFETAVGMVECSVVLRKTKEKSKTPVSHPPPNSIDSEAEEDLSVDAQLSQSTTDTGVCIE